MFCPNCGKESPEETDVNNISCDSCGYKSKPEKPVPPPLPETPPPAPLSTGVPPPLLPPSSTSAAHADAADRASKRQRNLIKVLIGVAAVFVAIVFLGVLMSDITDQSTSTSTSSPSAAPTTARPSEPHSQDIENVAVQSPVQRPSKASASSAPPKDTTIRRAAPPAALKVSARDLDSELSRNRIAFEQKYVGKMLSVSGKVEKVTEGNSNPEVCLRGSARLLGTKLVFCELASSEADTVYDLETGDDVVIVGVCTSPGEAFAGNYVQLVNCILAERPRKTALAVQTEGTRPVLTLKQLSSEVKANEPRAMRAYKGKRVHFKAKWDSVDLNYEGLPELNLMSFSTMCRATCVLRADQMNAAANLALNREITVDAIFEGGDCNWKGLEFRDGILIHKP